MLRPTWHFVLAEDIGWLLDLTGPRIRRVTGQQLRDGHGLDERSIGHAVAAVMEALASRGQLTRGQLADELREGGTKGSGQMQMILLAHAELEGLICSGPVAGGEHTYALMDERVPAPRRSGGPRLWPSSPCATSPGRPGDRTRPRLLGDAHPHRRARRPAAGA